MNNTTATVVYKDVETVTVERVPEKIVVELTLIQAALVAGAIGVFSAQNLECNMEDMPYHAISSAVSKSGHMRLQHEFARRARAAWGIF